MHSTFTYMYIPTQVTFAAVDAYSSSSNAGMADLASNRTQSTTKQFLELLYLNIFFKR